MAAAEGREDRGGEARALRDADPASRSGDWIDAGVVLVVAVVLLGGTTRIAEVPVLLSQGVSPTFFPRLLIAVLVVLALWLPFERRRSTLRAARVGGPVALRRVVAAVATMGVALACSRVVGVFPALGLAALGLGALWGERRPAALVALAVALPGVLYLVFAHGLGVHFDGGWLTGG